MATCPKCGTVNTGIVLQPILLANSPTAQSLAGVQIKTTARQCWKLECKCGWSVVGEMSADGKYLVSAKKSA